MNPKCPHCGRSLVNRLVDRCLYCEGELPEPLRLSEPEKEALREEKRVAYKKSQERRKSREKDRSRWSLTDPHAMDSMDSVDIQGVLEDLPWTKRFIPQYNELSLYLMSAAFLLLWIFDPSLQKILGRVFLLEDPRLIIVFVLFVGGLGLSLINVFFARKTSDIEKFLMLFFAVIVNAVTGILAGLHILQSEDVINQTSLVQGILLIFPVWNILSSGYTLFLFRLRIINESAISDELATLPQFFLGTGVLIILFLLCQFVFQLYWPITFSICVAYAPFAQGTGKGRVQTMHDASGEKG